MKAVLLLVLAFSALPMVAQESAKPAAQNAPRETVVVKAANVKWTDHPFVQGAKMCVEYGDPTKGPSVLMMKFPKGTTIPPHWHTSDEIATVVSGTGTFGIGETIDLAKGTEVGPGCYMAIPGKNPHWVVAKEDLVITVTVATASDFHACEANK